MALPSIDLRDGAIGVGGFVPRRQDAGDMAGTSVAGIGDINGDGLADILVGASMVDGLSNGQPDGGNPHVIDGSGGTGGTPVDLAAQVS